MVQTFDTAQLVRGLGLAVLLGLTVMACQQQPLPGVDPTPPRTSPPPAGSSQSTPPISVTGETSVPIGTIEEDSEGWTAKGVSPDQHQADLQSCYAFANAQVRNDEQINDDRGIIFGANNAARGGNLYAYNKALRPYASEQRFGELFSNCMISRGYQEN